MDRDGLLERVKGFMDRGRLYKGMEHERSRPLKYKEHAVYSDAPDYFELFNQFRSAPEYVKKHQSRFLSYFESCDNVLDIGCGRGEFLELLKEKGIHGHGVDLDKEMVELCGSKGLDVKKVDAVTYLRSIKDRSLDGIFTDDVIEHLETEYFYKMIRLCAKKLKNGSNMVIVTVNPLSWATFSNIFYIDLTHTKPIHPEAMKFILKNAGFSNVEIKFISLLPEREKLGKLGCDLSMNDGQIERIVTYNKNVEKLNEVLFGPENYAAIAKK